MAEGENMCRVMYVQKTKKDSGARAGQYVHPDDIWLTMYMQEDCSTLEPTDPSELEEVSLVVYVGWTSSSASPHGSLLVQFKPTS